jgi:hypothetical protein
MTVAEFALFEQILGQRVFPLNGNYWKRVRPLFYRPVLPFQEFSPGGVAAPRLGLLGGVQYAVPAPEQGNSFLNYLMFENARHYTVETLDYNRKRQVKLAAKRFEVQPMLDLHEFKQQAYPVYLSFYERTQYQYGSRRKDRAFFCQWADELFKMPQALVLGGYRNGILGGVSVSLLVEDTLCYAMFFCNTESLRLGLSDLMLHSVRKGVAEGQCASRIFAGLYKGGTHLDDFYLFRGCRLVRKPAFLRLNPLAACLLKYFLPGDYARFNGESDEAKGKSPENAGSGVESMGGLPAARVE